MDRRAFLSAAAALAAGLSGCLEGGEGGEQPTSTPTQTPDPTPTPTPSPTPPPTPDEPTPTPAPPEHVVYTDPVPLEDSQLSPDWSTSLPGQYELSTPGLDGDHMYIGSRRELTAVRLDSGFEAWQIDLGAMTHSFSPAVADETVIMSSRNVMGRRAILHGVDRRWEDPIPYDTPTEGQLLAAVEKSSGEFHWTQEVPVSTSPTLVDDVVYAGFVGDETGVLARSATTGEKRWRTPLDTTEIFATPAVDEHVYVASCGGYQSNSELISLTRDGDHRWSVPLEGQVYKGPAASNGLVFIGTDAGYLYAITPAGDEHWRAEFENGVYITPSVTDEHVYISAIDRVAGVMIDSGEKAWEGAVTDDARSGLSVSDGMVHVGGLEISAFDTDGEAAHWRAVLPGAAGSFGSPLYRDGITYTGACIKQTRSDWYDHQLYALS